MCCTGLWRGKPHSEFFEGSCDQYANYEWIIPKENERTLPPEQVHDKLLVFFTPATGAAYFQHFIDRGFSALMQVWYVLFYIQYFFNSTFILFCTSGPGWNVTPVSRYWCRACFKHTPM